MEGAHYMTGQSQRVIARTIIAVAEIKDARFWTARNFPSFLTRRDG